MWDVIPNKSEQTSQVKTDVTRLLDDGIEALRWCRQHVEERQAPMRLRDLELKLTLAALALDLEMEGRGSDALEALEHTDGQRRRPLHPHFIGNPDPPECG
jgi:hypothetical protein